MMPMTVAVMPNVKIALEILVQGMLGIFIFMAVFYLLIFALEHFFRPKEK